MRKQIFHLGLQLCTIVEPSFGNDPFGHVSAEAIIQKRIVFIRLMETSVNRSDLIREFGDLASQIRNAQARSLLFRFQVRVLPGDLPVEVSDLPLQVLFGGGKRRFGFNQPVRKRQRRGLAGFELVGKSDHLSFESGDFCLGRGQQVRNRGDSVGVFFMHRIGIPFAHEEGYRQPDTEQSKDYNYN